MMTEMETFVHDTYFHVNGRAFAAISSLATVAIIALTMFILIRRRRTRD